MILAMRAVRSLACSAVCTISGSASVTEGASASYTVSLAGTVKDGETVRVSVQEGRLTINGSRLAEAA